MGVRLHRVLLDQELDALVEGGGHGGWLFPQQNFHRIVGGQAHNVLSANWMRAALAVRTVDHSVCNERERVRHTLSGSGGNNVLKRKRKGRQAFVVVPL